MVSHSKNNFGYSWPGPKCRSWLDWVCSPQRSEEEGIKKSIAKFFPSTDCSLINQSAFSGFGDNYICYTARYIPIWKRSFKSVRINWAGTRDFERGENVFLFYFLTFISCSSVKKLKGVKKLKEVKRCHFYLPPPLLFIHVLQLV